MGKSEPHARLGTGPPWQPSAGARGWLLGSPLSKWHSSGRILGLLPRAARLGTGRGGAAREWRGVGWAGGPHKMWVIEISCGSPGTSGPSAPLSAFSVLIVLVTVSRLWLGVTLL